MRALVLATVTILAGSTALAFAGEGNGEPFPGPDFAVVSRTANARLAMKGQDPFSFAAGGASMNLGGYKQAVAKNQDPFPFSASAAVVGPQSSSAVAQSGAAGTHG